MVQHIEQWFHAAAETESDGLSNLFVVLMQWLLRRHDQLDPLLALDFEYAVAQLTGDDLFDALWAFNAYPREPVHCTVAQILGYEQRERARTARRARLDQASARTETFWSRPHQEL